MSSMRVKTMMTSLGSRMRSAVEDAGKFAKLVIAEGPQGTVAIAHVTRSRRLSLDPAVSPDSPIAWRDTMSAIRDHYALGAVGPIHWLEWEARRDVMRISAIWPTSAEPSTEAPIHIRGGREVRLVLATVEALRSWPTTRHLRIVAEADVSSPEPWEIVASLPNFTLIAIGNTQATTWSLELDAGTVSPPAVMPTRDAANPESRKPRLLVITALTPDTKRGSGSIDVYWFARHAVTLGCQVLVVPTASRPGDQLGRWELRRAGVDVVSGSMPQEAIAAALPAAVSKSDCVVVFDPRTVRDVRRWIEAVGGGPKLLFMPLDLQQFPLRALLDAGLADELGELGYRVPTEADYERVSAEEMGAIEISDLTAVISTEEVAALDTSPVRAKLTHLRMLRSDAAWVAQIGETPKVVFVGGFRHAPNYIAMGWFLNAIWPQITKRVPNAQLEVFGADLSPEWGAKWNSVKGVRIRGSFLDETIPYRGDVVAVAPLPYGGGTKGKVVSAIGHGAVVVGTRFASQGLPDDVQEAITTADSADEFAAAIVELLGDPARREQMRQLGREAYARWFAPTAGRHEVAKCLVALGLVEKAGTSA